MADLRGGFLGDRWIDLARTWDKPGGPVVMDLTDSFGEINAFLADGHWMDFEVCESIRIFIEGRGEDVADYPIDNPTQVYGHWTESESGKWFTVADATYRDALPYTIAYVLNGAASDPMICRVRAMRQGWGMTVKCPNCNHPGEKGLCVATGPSGSTWHERHCETCGGTNQISLPRLRWILKGRILRAQRIARGETLREAAFKFGCSPTILSHIEIGTIDTPEKAKWAGIIYGTEGVTDEDVEADVDAAINLAGEKVP